MHIVIIGNGVSGITAARHIRKRSAHEITVISDETDYFFSRTALMYVYMGHMRFQDTQPYESWFWEKNRIALLRTRIESIDFQAKTLRDDKGDIIRYDRLVLALGSRPNMPGIPGETLEGVQGLYHLQDLENMERLSARLLEHQQRAVIAGGGLIGVEMAEMFHSRGIPVTFLVRESDFWGNVLPAEESAMVSRHLLEHHIDLRRETELAEILPGPDGRHCGAVITKQGEKIDCGFVGLTIGVSPNIGFLRQTGLEIGRGILVNDFLETSRPDVFAVGDCAELRNPQPGRRAVEAVWYTARMMGETVADTICGKPTPYNPGIWFNSAKFFDIEYQVYGEIRAALPDDQATLYWEHPSGKKSIRINYERGSGRVKGFNLMGLRYRQLVCERWLRNGDSIETVLPQLATANFDPEFYPLHEAELLRTYNQQNGKNLQLKSKRGLGSILSFSK